MYNVKRKRICVLYYIINMLIKKIDEKKKSYFCKMILYLWLLLYYQEANAKPKRAKFERKKKIKWLETKMTIAPIWAVHCQWLQKQKLKKKKCGQFLIIKQKKRTILFVNASIYMCSFTYTRKKNYGCIIIIWNYYSLLFV